MKRASAENSPTRRDRLTGIRRCKPRRTGARIDLVKIRIMLEHPTPTLKRRFE
jgi:hypothetical protein